MGMPATDLERYTEVTTTTEEQKIFDRPEVKVTPNSIDFGDEDEDSAKKAAEAAAATEEVPEEAEVTEETTEEEN